MLLRPLAFPDGPIIRKPKQLDYIEEPDAFRDVFGLLKAPDDR